jgi:hypothetical protein
MNPQVVGSIALFVLVIWLPTLAVVAAYAFSRLRSRERLKAIEHGIDLAFDPKASADGTRRAAIVLVSLGVGIAFADVILVVVSRETQALVFLALAVIPLIVGVGLCIDYRIARKGTRA